MAKARNILFLMADQLAPQSLPFHGHKLVKEPRSRSPAARGTVFENAYTNSPMCVPARASLMTGQLGSTIGVYDSGSVCPAAIPHHGDHLGLVRHPHLPLRQVPFHRPRSDRWLPPAPHHRYLPVHLSGDGSGTSPTRSSTGTTR